MRYPDCSSLPLKQSLWDLPQGQKCRVQGFREDMDENYGLRLRELGFHPGETVTCVMASSFGAPRLYRVHNTVYSLDDRIARLIATVTEGGQ
jgi:Fe2+ transport system protein FeoA